MAGFEVEITPTEATPERISDVQVDSVREGAAEDEKNESKNPVHRIVYWKTAKTASSTIANIFNRHSIAHNLRIVKPADNVFLRKSSDFSGHRRQMNADRLPFDTACNHISDFDPSWLEELTSGAVIVTSLRNPASRLLSGILWDVKRLDKLPQERAITELEEGLGEHQFKPHPLRLPLLGSPGLERKLGFVFITEMLLESMILFSHRYGWPLEELLFVSFKESRLKISLNQLSERARNAISSMVSLEEQQLYDTWRTKIEQEWRNSPAKWREKELPEYKRMLANFSKTCSNAQPLASICNEAHAILERATVCRLAKTDSEPLSKLLRCASTKKTS